MDCPLGLPLWPQCCDRGCCCPLTQFNTFRLPLLFQGTPGRPWTTPGPFPIPQLSIFSYVHRPFEFCVCLFFVCLPLGCLWFTESCWTFTHSAC